MKLNELPNEITFEFLKNLSSDMADSVTELDQHGFNNATNGVTKCFDELKDGLSLRAWTTRRALSQFQRTFCIIVISSGIAGRKITKYEFKTEFGIRAEGAGMFKKHNGKWTVHSKVGATVGEQVDVLRKDNTFTVVRLTEIVSKKRDGSFLMKFEEVAKQPS